jgi:HEAT repeat protein
MDPVKLLRDLDSADAAVRLKASKQLETELRKAATKQRREHFGNVEVTTLLIAALEDPEPRVVHGCVVALAQVTRHYFKDDRAYAPLLGLLSNEQPLTTGWVIDALIHLRGEASLDDVLPLCAAPSPQVRAMAFHHPYAWLVEGQAARLASIRPKVRERLQAAAAHGLKDGDRTVRGSAAALLGEVGDSAVLPSLQRAMKQESYWLTEQTMQKAIKKLQGRQ